MIMSRPDPTVAVRALKSAAPYIRMYKNKIFVIKAGGAVFSDEASTRGLIEQVAILHQVGIKTVLVHGGGPQLDNLQAALGLDTRMVDGRRVTDQKSIDVTAMALNGLINTRILAICRALDIEAIGLSGVDAGLIRAHKRAPVVLAGSNEVVDYGFVGDRSSVPCRRMPTASCSISMPTPSLPRSGAPCPRKSWCCAPARRGFWKARRSPDPSFLTPTSWG
jgi:acetylglutamate kinase